MANSIKINRSVRLNGLNPLAYIGQNSYTPPDSVIYQRDPTVNDWQDFYVGCIWINQQDPPASPPIYNVWMLVSKYANRAKWIQFVSGAGGDLVSLTGDTGTNPVFGDVNENINIVGAVGINTMGDALNNTIFISVAGSIADDYDTDFATPAVPAGNVLQVKGGISSDAEAIALVYRKNIHTAANPAFSNLLEVKLNESVSLPNTTANGRQGVIYLGGSAAANRFMHNYGTANTFLGEEAGNLTLTTATSTDHVGIGFNALMNLTNTGIGNTSIGSSAGIAYTVEGGNVNIGFNNQGVAGEEGVTRVGAYGVGSPSNLNTFIGYRTGNNTYTYASATGNTFVGAYGGNLITTSTTNTTCGSAAGAALISGDDNTLIGSSSGAASFVSGVITGSQNTAVGNDTLWQADGSRNSVLGNGAGSQLTGASSDNIMINSLGAAGVENNTMRIGAGTGAGPFQLNATFISGIRGITTANADAIAVLIDSAGQLGTVSSSLRYKDNVVNMGSLSEDIYKLRPVVFNYRKHSPEQKSVGLIAEEVNRQMPFLVVLDEEYRPETVKYLDLIPMLLNEVQKLNDRIIELERSK